MHEKEALAWLYTQLPIYQKQGAKALKKGLHNIKALLAAAGHPHLCFPAVHIAGTNGKGSTAHTLAAILSQAGYTTGLYTSPHLKHFGERIKINGREIPSSYVTAYVEKRMSQAEALQPSFFELTVAMAFEYFAYKEVDIAFVETGLGGTWDSTNVLPAFLAVITTIDYDHVEILGPTLQDIAREKAGIIKPYAPVVLGRIAPPLLPIFSQKAQEAGAILHPTTQYTLHTHPQSSPFSRTVDVKVHGQGLYEGLRLDIGADYYLDNLPTVLETVSLLREKGFEVQESHVREGLGRLRHHTGLKGRWQVLDRQPLTFCDIAHNPAALTRTFAQIKGMKKRHLWVILGLSQEKDREPLWSMLPREATYLMAEAAVPRAVSAESLCAEARRHGFKAMPAGSVNGAIAEARQQAHREDLVYICGSAYLVGEIEAL